METSQKLIAADGAANDKAAQVFVHFIAEAQLDVIRQGFDKCHFFSLISDGATDSSFSEAEIAYIKYAIHGNVQTHFLGIRNVGSANAENISAVLTGILDSKLSPSWVHMLAGMGTDGASVMTGKVSGVVKRISEKVGQPQIFGVHCSAHRLELSYKDACKGVKYYLKIEALLLNLYYYYRNSPLNRHNLKEAFKVFARKPLMPTRVGGTRWLPHTVRAIQNLLKSYGPLTTHLAQVQSDAASNRSDKAAKAKNFLHLLRSKDCLYFLHFLLDLTTTLSHVSLMFQNKSATVADIYVEIEAAKATLQSLKEQDGTHLASLSGGESDVFDSQPIVGSLVSFPPAKHKLLDLLICSLDKRFGVDGKLLHATSVATLSLWPKTLQEQPDFGDGHMKTLAVQFGGLLEANGFHSEGLLGEWIRFKTLLYSSFDNIPDLSCHRVHQGLQTKTPNVLALMDLILSLPASSADAERSFSSMKIIRSDWRSRLGEHSLSDLMMVQLETPDIKAFIPDNSIHAWHKQGHRMPTFKKSKEICLKSALPLGVEDKDDQVVQFLN